MKQIITYYVECVEFRWFVWRKVGEGPLARIGKYTKRTEGEAAAEVAVQKRADIAAATRLGIEIEHKEVKQHGS